MKPISKQELQILDMRMSGLTLDEISRRLFVDYKTVQRTVSNWREYFASIESMNDDMNELRKMYEMRSKTLEALDNDNRRLFEQNRKLSDQIESLRLKLDTLESYEQRFHDELHYIARQCEKSSDRATTPEVLERAAQDVKTIL